MSGDQVPVPSGENDHGHGGSVIVAALGGLSGAAVGFMLAGHVGECVVALGAGGLGLCAGWLARGAR